MQLTDLFKKEDELAFLGAGMGSAAKIALPMLLIGLLNNITNDKKADSLAKALSGHEKDSLDIKEVDVEDGKKIVGHIFGNNRDSITNALARQNNISVSDASDLLGKIAPLVLGRLAKDTKDNRSVESLKDAAIREIQKVDADKSSSSVGELLGGLFDGEGLGDVFGDLLGSSSKKNKSGGLADIVGGMLGGNKKKKQPSILESILGEILKK